MSTTLPNTVRIQSTKGDVDAPVTSLGSTDVHQHKGGNYAHDISEANKDCWHGWYREAVKPHLLSWSFPREVQAIKDRAEQVLEEGIPSQKRTMLRNQVYGQLDQRWISQIAIGQDIERPFQRWSKAKRDTISVAICLDTTVASGLSNEMLKARMCLAAGLGGALEFLDYDVAIIGAHLQVSMERAGFMTRPRQAPDKAEVQAITCKDWNEPFTDSGLAHMADTGLHRLSCAWGLKSDGYTTQLTDREWRELTDADLLVVVGPHKGSRNVLNYEGLPKGATLLPTGDDTIYLPCDKITDLDPAVDVLEQFFNAHFGK